MHTIGRMPEKWIQKFQQKLLERDYSPITIRGYICDIKSFLQWVKSNKGDHAGFDSVISLDLINYRQYLVDDRKLRGTTTNRKIQAIRQFFQWASQEELIADDISKNIRFVRLGKRHKPEALQGKEVNALLRSSKTARGVLAKRNFALLQVILQAGIRVGEVANLCVSDITLSERMGFVHIRQGKGRKEREVPLNSTARKALLDYLEGRSSTTLNTPLFQSERGTALSYRSIQYIVTQLARKANITRIPVSAHTLRHTFATNYLQSNPGNLGDLASLMGHESLDTTAIYTRPSKEKLAEDIERISTNVYQ